jgi:small subunit ribosomal protein S17
MAEDAKKRGVRKSRTGVVVSKSGDKSVVVSVERKFPHPMYGKVLKRHSKCHVHDPKNEAELGDQVKIVETKPVSKMKKWRLAEIVRKKRKVQ